MKPGRHPKQVAVYQSISLTTFKYKYFIKLIGKNGDF